MPAREVFDGAMVILGGAFLLTPGFITDVIGAPAPDPADPGAVPRHRRPRWPGGAPPSSSGSSGWGAGRASGGGPRREPARGYDYEGTAREVTERARAPRPSSNGG